MLDIFKEVQIITDKYGINTQKYIKQRLEELIGKILSDAASKYGSSVIVRGLKATDEKNYPFLLLVQKYLDIVAVQDISLTKECVYVGNKQIPVISVNESISDCDIYLINAINKGGEITHQVKGLKDRGIKVLDLYDEIKNRYGIALNCSYELINNGYDYTRNRIVDALKKHNREKSAESLKNVLGQCLCLGDFLSFFRVKEENQEIVSESVEIISLIEDVQELITKIKHAISMRSVKMSGKKDIVWHWVDNVGYEDINLLPSIHKRIKEGIFFYQAYTPTPYTAPTLRAIFYKEFRNQNEKKEGKYSSRNLENSELYQRIIEEGYQFEAFGLIKNVLGLGDWKDEEASIICSMLHLKMLQTILNSKKPCFCLVHTLSETHSPYASPWEDISGEVTFCNVSQELKKKIRISSEYADKVIDFYSNLLADQIIGIYMSDHGKWSYPEKRRYKDESLHTILGVTNLGIKAEVHRLLSYKNFDQLINFILVLNTNDDEMLIGDLNIYSKKIQSKIKNHKGDVQDICSGFKGVNTLKDKYVSLDNGTEYYFLKADNESQNHINNLDFQRRVAFLKERLKNLLSKNS